jgi:ABC-type branched-subunit amino acid transport system ATPase component/ABC-type branched-subunit amino acid transport system permease subunit
MIIMGVALVCAIGLWIFLKRARIGLAMRAVVTNPDLLEVSGTRAVVARRWAWIVASVFAGLSGVLLALSPTFGASPGTVEALIVPAFGAAAIGMFVSLPLAYVGGLVVGIAYSLLTGYVNSSWPAWLIGLPSATPYLVLLVVLLVIPRRRLEPTAPVTPQRASRDPRFPLPVNVVLGIALVALVVLIPGWAGFGVTSYTTTLIYVVLFLSLGLLLKTAGLVSLCQIGFAAIGATAFAELATNLHFPWLLAIAGAIVIAGAVGTIVALSAIRLSGVFLALATLAFGYVLQQLFYPTTLMFGVTSGSLVAPRPSFASSDDAYYVLVAVAVALCVAVVLVLDRTRLGRLLRGMSDSPVALQVQGTSIQVTKLVVFGVSAAMAGLAGALFAGLNNYVTPAAFPASLSLTLVAVVFVLRVEHPWYAFAAAVAFYLVPAKLDILQAANWTQLIFGALAVATVILGLVARQKARAPAPEAAPAAAARAPAGVAAPGVHVLGGDASAARRASSGLDVQGLTVRFGGLVALDAVDLRAPTGTITGLIGPNGAGKTTLFNACCGILRPNSGRIVFHGADISHRRVASRARLGLGRTFQKPELFDSLTVREAVALGNEASQAGANPLHHLLASGDGSAERQRAIDEAIALSGVEPFADQIVAELSAAQRRLVELARCLSGPFDLLLLDEPTAGLDRTDSRRFASTLREIVEVRGVGVLVVEHDMSVVMDVCERVTVLDFGTLIFEGTPSEVIASDAVRTAYLGDLQPTVATAPGPDPVGEGP